ncbi:hypothetical protein NDU88_006844 [Pleurodeles waltl]|uniref:Uncharacterized protein n=1 Tax=Pleurodeles waltl TaxID=8319 RepID=A0AAV7NRG9_PLEWA|nr:hypothetical protein NDU88_006844 [Pleurodeles waltl]
MFRLGLQRKEREPAAATEQSSLSQESVCVSGGSPGTTPHPRRPGPPAPPIQPPKQPGFSLYLPPCAGRRSSMHPQGRNPGREEGPGATTGPPHTPHASPLQPGPPVYVFQGAQHRRSRLECSRDSACFRSLQREMARFRALRRPVTVAVAHRRTGPDLGPSLSPGCPPTPPTDFRARCRATLQQGPCPGPGGLFPSGGTDRDRRGLGRSSSLGLFPPWAAASASRAPASMTASVPGEGQDPRQPKRPPPSSAESLAPQLPQGVLAPSPSRSSISRTTGTHEAEFGA